MKRWKLWSSLCIGTSSVLVCPKDSWLTDQSMGDMSFTRLLSFMGCWITSPVTETWFEKRTCDSGSSQVLPDRSGQDPEKRDCWPGSGPLPLTQTRGRQKLVTAWIHNIHNRHHNCKGREEKSHDIDDPRANPEGPSPSQYSAKMLWVPRNLNKKLPECKQVLNITAKALSVSICSLYNLTWAQSIFLHGSVIKM